jgi:hypothetical protein
MSKLKHLWRTRSARAATTLSVALVTACLVATAASAFTQTVSSGANLNAVSCVPATTDCIIAASNGNAFYSTTVSATAEATWNAWSGPASPNEAVACPSSTLCVLGDGNVEEGSGGKMYYATLLGSTWTQAFNPVRGVVAVSCPSSSFCVDGQAGGGRIRYSTNPASSSWSELQIGTGAVNSVSCLSSSFCAAVNTAGTIYIANTETHITEASGWKSTSIDTSGTLHGVACTSTSSCVAVDGAGNVVNVALSGEGTATTSSQDIDGANELTAVTCASTTCAAVDSQGNIFVSTNSGTSWSEQYLVVGSKLTSVSCASTALCVAVDASGNATMFDPDAPPPSHTQLIDSGNGLNATSCIASTSDCVVSDTKGKAYYATNVSNSANGTWTTWNGPSGQSPSQAVNCPTTTLCVLADGKAEEGGGGKMYYGTTLGGAWKEAFTPTYGVVSVSCGSASLCVSGQAEGFIRYTTKPASGEWFALEFGFATMSAVDCLSASFCAVVDSKGTVHIATTEAKIKEATGWKSTSIDGTTALRGISCMSTTSCVAVDSAGSVLNLSIESTGAAASAKTDIDGVNELTAVSCSGSSTCVAVDAVGNVFASNNKGVTWVREHQLADKLTSVSCSSTSLCLAADTTGNVTAFDIR